MNNHFSGLVGSIALMVENFYLKCPPVTIFNHLSFHAAAAAVNSNTKCVYYLYLTDLFMNYFKPSEYTEVDY